MKVLSSRRHVALGLAATVAALGAVGAAYAPIRDSNTLVPEPTLAAHAHETESFDNPASLIAGSDLVVTARVQGSGPGQIRGDEEGEGHAQTLTDRVVTLRVTHLFAPGSDSRVAIGDEIEVLEGFWDSNKEGISVNGVSWSPDGAEGIFFLHKMNGEELYRANTSYGRLLYNAQEDLIGPSGENVGVDGPWRDVSPERLRTIEDASKYVSEIVRSLP